MPSIHPASLYHAQRRLVFGIFEKNGFDAAMDYIKNSRLIPPTKAGLKGEIIFYEKNKENLKLEPLLDVGVKADFTGIKKQKMVNFDVTTNISYKDIDKYLDVMQKRKKMYEIALVNPKTEEITLFPLKFPICPKCGKFSHHILYLEPSSTDTYRTWKISDTQTVIHFCPNCNFFEEKITDNFQIPSVIHEIELMEHELVADYGQKDTAAQIDTHVKNTSISTVQFFEKNTNLLISGFAENKYVFTGTDGEGYYDGKVHWRHPLAKKLGEYLGIFYGKWYPNSSELKSLFEGKKCKVCGRSSYYFNAKNKTMKCRVCGVIYDISKAVHAEGYELQKTQRRKYF